MPRSTAGATAAAISWLNISCLGAPKANRTRSGEAARTRSTMGALAELGAERTTRGESKPTIWSDGAVGVLLDQDVSPSSVVSQGCRPIGAPFTVTGSDGTLLTELGGRPALERLMGVIADLDEADRSLAAHGLHCGIVIDDRKLDYERGDFLIRGVLGADRDRGAIAVGDHVPVGATVQFHVRDAASADDDLNTLLVRARVDGPAKAALVFTCNGRGFHLFGSEHHDAEAVQEALGPLPLAGMFCAGEIGPLNGRNHLHGFTASVAVFR